MNPTATASSQDIPLVVRTLLTFRRKNQADLAAHLGVTEPTVSKMLRSNRDWTIKEVRLVADFLDVSYNVLLEDPESLVRNRYSPLVPISA